MPDEPRIASAAEGTAMLELDLLRTQAIEARAELHGLRAEIALTRRDRGGEDALRLVNEQLVCSALRAQLASEDCHETLRVTALLAERDPLTGLPNRALLLDRLVHTMAHARRKAERLALLFIDLDGFKQVNDAHGHATGDLVLQQAARRLLQVVREEDTVSRHGGDEFLVLLADIDSDADVAEVAEKLLGAFARPIVIGAVEVVLQLSIGISFFPDDGDVAGELIERADAAMYAAKAAGGHCAIVAGRGLPRSTPAVHRLSELTTTAADDRRQVLLRDANERLLLAAIDSRQSQEAAETAHRLQRENLAVVAHELRGPLSPLRVAAALLPRLAAHELPRVQAIIERGVTQMTRLVGDLLDLSRVHTGKLRLERKPIDLLAVLEHAVDAARPLMEERGHRFSVELGADPLAVSGDAIRLDQVFRNLLDNAAKYTPRGGHIRLTGGLRCGVAEVMVSDSGIGIPLGSLDRVFEPFAQDGRAVQFNAAGLGIGLTVVRELVEAHGGAVVASSEGTDRGSSFVVTLPLLAGGADAVAFAPSGTDTTG
jgi:diguanylate cyclase